MEAPVLRDVAALQSRSVLSNNDMASLKSTLSMMSFDEMPTDSPQLTVSKPKKAAHVFDDGLSFYVGIGASQAVPAQVKAAPAFLNLNTTCSSQQTPAEVWDRIQELLREREIDFTANDSKLKIDAVVYDPTLPSRFRVRVYRGENGGSIVAFQKRDGCHQAYHRLFAAVAADIGDNGKRITICSLEALPLPDDDDSDDSAGPADDDALCLDDNVHALIDNLIELIGSGYADQEKQAAAALVELSASHHLQVYKYSSMIQVLLRLLRSPDEDVVRCAALIFANIAPHCSSEAEADVAENLLGPLFSVLTTPSTIVNRDTKRHVSEAMITLFETFSGPRPFPRQFMNTLTRFRCASDDKLRSNILRAEEALQRNCTIS